MSSRCDIYIIGAQSTGKTTLVTALATYFEQHPADTANTLVRPKVITEVARGVLQRHNFTADDIVSSKTRALELQRLILGAQCEAERAACNEWYISDRSGLDPLVYARQYVGINEASTLMREDTWQYLERKMRTGLVIVCEAGGEWLIDDGVRLMPQDRKNWLEMHTTFCEMLDELHIDFHVLPVSFRDLSSRVEFVVEEWKRRPWVTK
ncbi:MAG: hypothetical protein L6R39_003798 [Caloplaca ligustica]|nr:MAG: hypothetical protein L6R39_003798 [Caloplaca ligustica]